MNFIFKRIFWGCLIVLIGVLYLLNNIFNFNIPIWDIFWPLVIIFIGFSILDSRRGIKTKSQIIFDEGEINVLDESRDYSTVFGKSTYDFRRIKLGKENISVEANTVFGSTEILIDENIPMKIKATSAFGGIRLPNGETVAFGDREYMTKAYKKDSPYIVAKVSAVFSGVEVISKS